MVGILRNQFFGKEKGCQQTQPSPSCSQNQLNSYDVNAVLCRALLRPGTGANFTECQKLAIQPQAGREKTSKETEHLRLDPSTRILHGSPMTMPQHTPLHEKEQAKIQEANEGRQAAAKLPASTVRSKSEVQSKKQIKVIKMEW